MSYANLTGTISSADESTIKTALQTIINTLQPYSPTLTLEDRQSFYKLGPNRVALALKVQAMLTNNPSLQPPGFALTDFNDDLSTYGLSEEFISLIYQALELAYNTRIARGSEGMNAVKKAKGYIDYKAGEGDAVFMAAKAELDPFYDLPSQPEGTDPLPARP